MGERTGQPRTTVHLLQQVPVNAPKNPMGCYELARFPSRDAMIDELMTIYATRPTLNLPPVQALLAFFNGRQSVRRGKRVGAMGQRSLAVSTDLPSPTSKRSCADGDGICSFRC